MAKVLIVEDDLNLADSICDRLTTEHHTVESTDEGDKALQLLRAFPYDLVILDWDLPGMSGIEVCKQYRATGGTARILMLTGKDAVEEKELGFTVGVDDYLTKPFSIKELVARTKALMRRSMEVLSDDLTIGDLVLSTKSFKVTKGGTPLQLTPKEFALLEFFMRHPEQVFNGEAVLERVWHSEAEVSTDTVKATIHRLRTKLGTGGAPSIVTIAGAGYKLVN